MNNSGLINPVLNFTGFNFLDGLNHIKGNCAGLGVGHEPPGSKYTAQFTHCAHHIRGSYSHIKRKPAFLLNFFNIILSAYEIRPGLGSFSGLIALGKDQHFSGFTCTVGEYNSPPHLLISMSGVNTQPHYSFNSFVELGGSKLFNQFQRLNRFVHFHTFNLFGGI